MAKKSKGSSKPTGITISRKDDTEFVAKWKQGGKYNKQDFDYSIVSSSGTTSWKSVSVKKNDNSAKFNVTQSNVKAVRVRIRGHGKKWTDYGTKTMKIKKPYIPKITPTVTSDNTTDFQVDMPADKEKRPAAKIEWEWVTIENYNGKPKTPEYWKNIPTDKSEYDTEHKGSSKKSKLVKTSKDGSLDVSKTTIIRARAYGLGGYSDYKYSVHTYAAPHKPTDVKVVSYSTDKNAKTTKVTLSWVVADPKSNPIDDTTIQYVITTPVVYNDYEPVDLPGEDISPENDKARLELFNTDTVYYYKGLDNEYHYAREIDFIAEDEEDSGMYRYETFYTLETEISMPSEVQPNDGKTQKDTGGQDSATLILDTMVSFDQCLWVRVVPKHDGNPTPSDYILVREAIGQLAPPTLTGISTDPQTYKATISAQNNSAVSGSFVAIVYQDEKSTQNSGKVIGIIPSGGASVSIQCPKWGDKEVNFGAFAVCGTINIRDTKTLDPEKGVSESVTEYAFNDVMRSSTIYNGGNVPVPPTGVTAIKDPERDGTIQVKWNTPWLKATGAEISWADHDDAWYSTDGPSSYTVESTKEPILNISNLEKGKKYYVRVRLFKQTDSNETIYGAPSEIIPVDLSEAPAVPVLELSNPAAPIDTEIKASWAYISSDETMQESAVLAELIEGEAEPKDLGLNIKTEQYAYFTPRALNWELGSTHKLVLMVSSTGGQPSSWSVPVEFLVSEPPECTITSTSLVKNVTENEMQLTELPFRVKVTGATSSDVTSIVIRRFEDYPMERPDDSDYVGYEGDVIYQDAHNGDAEFVITRQNLSDYGTQFDDGAKYELCVGVSNGLQSSSNIYDDGDGEDEDGEGYLIPDPDDSSVNYEYFTVNWVHQAIEPDFDVEMIDNDVAKITINTPTSTDPNWELQEGDHVDIYRLSAGKPQLIVANGEFGTVYIDPYPTIGKRGGYRVVFVTDNGDYIIKDADGERPDWLNEMDNAHINTRFQYIDFDGTRILFKFNVKFSNSWKKNFTLTHYLSGKVEGDWLAGTEHTNNITGVTIDDLVDDDIENGTLDDLYDLAEYSNMCHIRTIEGFNYPANIEVGDSSEYGYSEHPHNITLNVTEVSNSELDGLTYDEWKEEQEAGN